MTSTVSSPPTLPGMLDELFAGRLRWDLLRPFPSQDPAERAAGDAAVARLGGLLREHVDPDVVDRTGRLPDGLVAALRRDGWFSMLTEHDLGGLALSPANALRALQAAAALCPAVALMLGTSNGFGAGNYLPILDEGPLRDLVLRHLKAGSAHGTADTESRGAASDARDTTATAIDGGENYLINGEKIYIGNGMIAGLLDVSATVTQDGAEQVRIFFVETDSPGVELVDLDFMGLHGAPFGVVRLTDVKVPASQLLPSAVDLWRDDPALVRLAVVGRMLTIGPASLAIAKLCLAWSRDFVSRRAVDGRPLGEYEEIQRYLAQTAADVFTVESVAEWVMLSANLAGKAPEMTAAKNLLSVTCWQAMDRTLSLFAAEGYESVPSKARRGAPQVPVDRFLRDARGLRISGGVDFLLDIWTALASMRVIYGPDGPAASSGTPPVTDLALPPRCQDHLAHVQDQTHALAELCRRLVTRRGLDALAEGEHDLMLAGRIATLLFGMAVVLARAAHLAEQGNTTALDLADVSCAQARAELAMLWAQLAALPGESHFTGLSSRLLEGTSLDFLLADAAPGRRPGTVRPADD